MSESSMTRRGLLQRGGTAAAGAAALAATGTASAQSDYGGWLSNVSNYDGSVADKTGQDSVTIEVGAQANGGPYGFSPPAVKVSPGTTVTWKWVKGSHNVEDNGGGFKSKLTSESGFTFEQQFEETGVTKYFCMPHKAMGMKGVVEVVSGGGGSGGGGSGGDGSGSGSGAPAGETTDAMGSTGDGGVGGLVVGGLVLAFASPALFAAFLRNRDLGRESEDGQR